MERFLQLIHRHPRWAWAGMLGYAACVTFPHEQVQVVVGSLASLITHKRLYLLCASVTLFLGALLSLILIRQIRGRPDRGTLSAYWILTLVLIFGTWRLLTANNTELVHYPQYVPEGMALVAITFSPAESLAWLALFGGLDEGYQYAFLTSGRLVPFDFNDIYMDILGGTIGVLLGIAFLPVRAPARITAWRRIFSRPGILAIFGIVVVGFLLWGLGLMRLHDDKANPNYWFSISHSPPDAPWLFQRAWGPNKFHELLPLEAVILILATIAVYAVLDRRVKMSGKM